MNKIIIFLCLLISTLNIYAAKFNCEQIDSIVIKCVDYHSMFFGLYSIDKSKFDIIHSENKMNPIIKLQNKESIILFTSILNNLKKEDIIITPERVYHRIKFKKLSDTISFKNKSPQQSIYTTQLIKIKGKYYLSYHIDKDPFEVRCKINIYAKNKLQILWMCNLYIDIDNNRYDVSNTLGDAMDSFIDYFMRINKKPDKGGLTDE